MDDPNRFEKRLYSCCKCQRVQHIKASRFRNKTAACKSCKHKYLRRIARTESAMSDSRPDIVYADGGSWEDRIARGESPPDLSTVPPFEATGDIPIDDTAFLRDFV